MKRFPVGLVVCGAALALYAAAVVAVAVFNSSRFVPVRQVAIPFAGFGLTPFGPPTVIRSEAELESYLAHIGESQESWSSLEHATFVDSLRNSGVKFSEEVLVLVPDEDGSGSAQMRCGRPYLCGRVLVCPVTKVVPTDTGCGIVCAYDCAAFVVSSREVDEVTVMVTELKE